jgi:hypothetical protein
VLTSCLVVTSDGAIVTSCSVDGGRLLLSASGADCADCDGNADCVISYLFPAERCHGACIETPTPSNTALLEKPTAVQLAEKPRSVKRTRNLLSCPQDPPLDCVMTNQMNPVHVFASCSSFKVHFRVVRRLTLRYSHLPSHFSLKIMCVFLVSPMRATCLIISC